MVTIHHCPSNGFLAPLFIFENGDYSPLYVKWFLTFLLLRMVTIHYVMVSQHHPWFCENGDYSPLYIKWFSGTTFYF